MMIASDILPHKIWEAGPDVNGKIATTNTITDLSNWPVLWFMVLWFFILAYNHISGII